MLIGMVDALKDYYQMRKNETSKNLKKFFKYVSLVLNSKLYSTTVEKCGSDVKYSPSC